MVRAVSGLSEDERVIHDPGGSDIVDERQVQPASVNFK